MAGKPRKAKTDSTAQPSKASDARKKILLVDDHPMMRIGVTALINAEPDLQVIAQANTAEEALTQLPQFKPDLVVTDMTMPGRGGLEFIKDVKALYPGLPVLVVSMHDERSGRREAAGSDSQGVDWPTLR